MIQDDTDCIAISGKLTGTERSLTCIAHRQIPHRTTEEEIDKINEDNPNKRTGKHKNLKKS